MNSKQCSTESKYSKSSTSCFSKKSNERRVSTQDWIRRVPSLAKLSLQTLANQPNILEEQEILSQLNDVDLKYFYEVLPCSTPLEQCTQYIPDGIFWRNSAFNRWNSLNDCSFHGGSWRQLYLERHLAEMIEHNECISDNEQLICTASLAAPFVKKLVIKQLKVLLHNNDDNESGVVNLNEVFSPLIELEEVDLRFGVLNVGMNFEKKFFVFNKEDCANIGEGLVTCTKLHTISIRRCNMSSKKLTCLLEPIVTVSALRTICLPHCSLGNRAMSVIRDAWKSVPLQHLDLTNNMISIVGLEKLLEPLEDTEVVLDTLKLSLNPLCEEGGVFLFENIEQLKKLRSIHVDGTQISNITACAIATFLENSKIKHIFLNNNTFEAICGEMFFESVQDNKFINTLDLRMTGISSDCIRKISYNIRKNLDRKLRPTLD